MTLPTDINEINLDLKALKTLLKRNGVPREFIAALETRSLRSGRRLTGIFKSNRNKRWTLINNHPVHGTDPQFGTEVDCKIIMIILLLTCLEFKNAPIITDLTLDDLAIKYIDRAIVPGNYKDSLLLEVLDYNILVHESLNPTHGYSSFHIGHIDPKKTPKHSPSNVEWRTWRSNLIQGDMTLRQARIYILRLIGRYFELGELEIE